MNLRILKLKSSLLKKQIVNQTINEKENDFFISKAKNKISIIVGENGAGKSRFLKEFFRYLNLNNYEKITFISRFELPTGIKSLTVFEYFDAVLDTFCENWFEKVKKYMNFFKFKFDLFSSFISELSGGERRLILLISQILLNNKIMIIDEPELYLSKENKDSLINIFKDEFKNKTIIIATHSTSFAKLGQQTFFIKKGELKEMPNIKNDKDMKKVLWKDKEVFDDKYEF